MQDVFNLYEGVVLSKHVTHYGPLKFSILLPYNPPLVKDSLVYRCITSFDPVVFFIFRQNASVPRCVFSLLIMDLGDCHIFIPDL
jgi:hypothetical protein